MSRLFLLRHGQTIMNEQNRKQGLWDSPLTAKGIEQAKLAGRYLKARGIPFDHAYSSPAGRACDTLELAVSLPYRRIPGLREISFGLYEGISSTIGAPRKPYGDFYVAFGGEGEAHVQKRMVETCRQIMDQKDHEYVLVASHGAACIWFAKAWCDLDRDYASIYPLPNCTIFEYDYDPKSRNFTLLDVIVPEKQEQFVKEYESRSENKDESGRKEPPMVLQNSPENSKTPSD